MKETSSFKLYESLPNDPSKCRSNQRDCWPIVHNYLKPHMWEPRDFDDCPLPDLSDIFVKDIYYPKHFMQCIQSDIGKKYYNPTSSAGEFAAKQWNCKTQEEVYTNKKYVNNMRSYIHRAKMGDRVAFLWRVCVVEAKEDIATEVVKKRVAWVPDISLLHMEKMFALPLLECMDHKSRVPTPENCHNLFCNRDSLHLDIKSFDMNTPGWLIHKAFKLIRSHFSLDRYDHGARPYSWHSLERLWDLIVSNFIHSRFVVDGNRVYRKHDGVPSGSAFTNIIDTICSRLVAQYACWKQQRTPCRVKTYGDDTIIRCHDLDHQKVQATYAIIGYDIKFEPILPGTYSCYAYCKAWCDRGISFHPGQWYRDIIECVKDKRYLDTLILALILTFEPTRVQCNDLLRYVRNLDHWTYDSLHNAPDWIKNLITSGNSNYGWKW